MKTIIILTVLIFLIIKCDILEGQEVWHENIYIPSDNSQSAPHSIIYNDINNMIYVYTGQKIIYLSKLTGIIQGSLVVGETGYFSYCISTIKRTNKLAFDHEHNRIFCSNEDDELLVIDCSDVNKPEIIHEFASQIPLESSFLFFNPEIEKLYWVQNSLNQVTESKLVSINTNSLTEDGNYSTNSYREIFDLAFCHQNDYVAISIRSSVQDAAGVISLLDSYTLIPYDSYTFSDYSPNKMIYIGEANRLYCLTTNTLISNANLTSFLVDPGSNQLTYQPDHSINDFPIYESQSACYIGGTTHYIYIPGKPMEGSSDKIVILDYIEPINGTPIVEELELPGVDQVILNAGTNRVYSSGSTINRIFQTEIEYTESAEGTANHLIQAGSDRIAISNIEGNSVNIFTMTLEFDFTFHKGSEKLILTHHDWEESVLTIIDGESENIQEISSDAINILQSGSSDFTYLGGHNVLEYIDMTSLSIGQVQYNQMINYHIIDFALLSNGNCLALVTEDGFWGCRLVEIDKTSNAILGEGHSFDIYPKSEGGLFYNAFKNQIYLLSEYSLTIINPLTYSIITTIYTSDYISECHYSPLSDKIIICYGASNILFYNGSTFELLQDVTLPSLFTHIASFYDQANDRLYVQAIGLDYPYPQNQIRLLAYLCVNHQLISNTYLHQNQAHSIWGYTPYAKMVLDEDNNYLYIPNQGLGNISKVECPPDKIPLNPKVWNWISIPRLDQANSPVPAQLLLEEIQMFPDTLRMTNVPLDIPYSEEYIRNRFGNWSGNLATIQSTFGYKLIHSEPTTCYLPMVGDLPDPGTTFTIYPGHENWVGYFLPETQSPFEAIPASVLANLKSIKAQYWSCLNYAFIAPPPKSSASSIGEWRCLCNRGKVEIEYNDMVILSLGKQIQQAFSWNQSGGGGAIIEKGAPEFFDYNEKADYESIFIELDPMDLPEEIGAFAGDTCIGATKVLPNDTSVMICAYSEGFEGEEINFELLYSTKTSRPVIDDYQVFNIQSRIMENRKITVGENQSFYLVSLKNSSENVLITESVWMKVYPNPAKNETSLSYFLAQDSWVKIVLFNLIGNEIINWEPGMQNAGEHRFKICTSNLPAGYYHVKMVTENQTIAEKMLVVH